jgi:predicted permease
MGHVLSITLPIYLLIALGFAATRFGMTTKEEIRGIGVLVVRFALPALIFRALSQRTVDEIMNLKYLTAYGAGSLISFALMFGFMRFARKRRLAASGMAGLGSSASNSGFVGFPIAAMIVGPGAVVALALNLIVESLLIIPLGLGLAESESRQDDPLHEILFFVLRRLTRNPLVLAIFAGTAASIIGVPLPPALFKAVDLLANAATPAALFAIGGTLAGLSLSGLSWDAPLIAGAKLFIHPLAVAGGLLLAPGLDPQFKKAAIIYAAGPMASVYPLLAHPYDKEGVAAAALLGATFLSFFTLSALLLVI